MSSFSKKQIVNFFNQTLVKISGLTPGPGSMGKLYKSTFAIAIVQAVHWWGEMGGSAGHLAFLPPHLNKKVAIPPHLKKSFQPHLRLTPPPNFFFALHTQLIPSWFIYFFRYNCKVFILPNISSASRALKLKLFYI